MLHKNIHKTENELSYFKELYFFFPNCGRKKGSNNYTYHHTWILEVDFVETQMHGNIETLLSKFKDVYFVSLCLCPNSLKEIVLMW